MSKFKFLFLKLNKLFYPVLLLALLLVNRLSFLENIATHVFRGVPNFYTWITLWNCHSFMTFSFSEYWASNAMYPYSWTMAMSENMFGLTPFSLLVRSFTDNPILFTNILSFLLVYITSLSMFYLLRKLFDDSLIALLGSVIFSFYPWIMKTFSLGRFHMVAFFTLPIALYLNLLFWERCVKSKIFKIYFILFSFIIFWSLSISIYTGTFLTILMFIWTFLYLFFDKEKFNVKKIFLWFLAVFFAWLAMLPVFYIYKSAGKSTGVVRTIDDQRDYTGPIWSWLVVPDENYIWGQQTKILPKGSKDGIVENFMFPGFTVIFLFLTALICKSDTPWIKALKGTSIFLFILSLGTHIKGLGFSFDLPYTWFWQLCPPLQGTRNPHRFAPYVIFIAAVIIADFFKNININKKKNIIIILLLLVSFESFSSLKVTRAMPSNLKFIYSKIAKIEKKPIIAEFPFSIRNDLRAMAGSTYNWHKVVNGVTGLWPPLPMFFADKSWSSPRYLKILNSLGVNILIINSKALNLTPMEVIVKAKESNFLAFMFKNKEYFVFSFKKNGNKFRHFKPLSDFCWSLEKRNNGFVLNIEIGNKKGIIFNPQSPSNFSFTPSKLWGIRVLLDGKLIHKESWKAPPIFDNFNCIKKINLFNHKGFIEKKICLEIDIMDNIYQISPKKDLRRQYAKN